ncbi:hypothetical protein MCAMS1_02554 [biofilm metagenome]
MIPLLMDTNHADNDVTTLMHHGLSKEITIFKLG